MIKGLIFLAFLLGLFLPNLIYAGVTIYDDSDDKFFTDASSAAPVDGNHGATIGEQRIIATFFVEKFIESIFDASVDVSIGIQYEEVSGSLLASATPSFFYGKDSIPNLPLNYFHYPVSLAKQYHGSSFNAQEFDIEVSIGNNPAFYYGYSTPPLGKVSYIGLLIHEIIHGLGFFDNISTYFGGQVPPYLPSIGLPSTPTIFDAFLIDKSSYNPAINFWFLYTPSDMIYAKNFYNVNRLWWDGFFLQNQVQKIKNNYGFSFEYWSDNSAPIQLINNNNTAFTSSHFWDGLVYNNEVMEPFLDSDSPYNHVGLAKFALKDIGWVTHPNGDKPSISLLDSSITILNNYPNSNQLMKFAIWDNDNEMHLVNSYGAASTANPAHPNLNIGVFAESSNQSIIPDENLNIYCAESNNSNCSIGELYITHLPGVSGSSIITITTIDSDGNSDSESFNLTIMPNTQPTIDITSPSNGHVFLTANQSFSALANDNEDGTFNLVDWGVRLLGYAWQYDNAVIGDWSTGLTDGSYEVSACVKDSDDNNQCDLISFSVSANADFDDDGISNANEVALGSDPYNNDSDNDGLLDGIDPHPLVPDEEVPDEDTFIVPAMGGIGLLALGLSMLGLGAVRMRRK